MSNSRTPLSPADRDALEQLEAYVKTAGDETVLTRETAVAHLVEGEFEQAEARERIEQLLLKGYLYEVDEELRIPPRPYD